MKRSNHVILTAIFLTAVSAATARGQEVNPGVREPGNANANASDSTNRGHSHGSGHATRSGRHGFLGIFRGHHHTYAPSTSTATTSAPRTRGFGTTMQRSATSSVHS